MTLRGDNGSAYAAADADGHYALTVVPGAYYLAAGRQESDPFFLATGTAPLQLDSNRVQDLTLPALTLTVKVRDAAGNPVAGAYVSVTSTNVSNAELFPGYPAAITDALSAGSTDAAGAAIVPWLPTASADVEVVPPPESGPITNLTVGTLTSDTAVTVTLPAVVLMSGVVRDAHGQPAPGANVIVRGDNGTTEAVADAAGHYIVAVVPGAYYLAAGRQEAGPPFFLATGSSPLQLDSNRVQDLTLPALTLTLKVRDAAGNPVAGAYVSVTSTNISNTELFPGYPATIPDALASGSTDAAGEASVPWLPSASAEVEVLPPPEIGPDSRLTIGTVTSDTTVVVTVGTPPDTVPPAAPSTPDLASSADSGISDADDVTRETTLSFSGTAETGSTVTLYRGSTAVAQTTADSSTGSWFVVDTVNADGIYDYAATATDAAGNTSEPSGMLRVTVDTLAPTLNINGAASGTYNLSDLPARPTFEPADGDGSGVASVADTWTTPTTPTGVGAYTYAAYASDVAGNSASETRTYDVVYGPAFSNYLPPINPDGSSRFRLGSTIPLKFKLVLNGIPISNAIASLSVASVDNVPDPGETEPIFTPPPSSGTLFRYDPQSGNYIFNLSTKNSFSNSDGTGISSFSVGTWALTINLDDGTSHTVHVQLVK